jgi:ubiquinone/menaquinone biosynthesis C-methylase UbiE
LFGGYQLTISGNALEIASGSGQHVICFAKEYPNISFQPTDIDPKSLLSIQAYIADSGLKNISNPIDVDVKTMEGKFKDNSFNLVINCNMIHISGILLVRAFFSSVRANLYPTSNY